MSLQALAALPLTALPLATQQELPLFPEQASTMAPKVDALFAWVTGLAVIFTVLVSALVIYFAVKYRRVSEDESPKAIHGSLPLELAWTFIPLVLALATFYWGGHLFFEFSRPPDGAMDIYVVGKQWMWKFQHPEGAREINELHVPVGRAVKLTLATEDVIHSFYVPAFRVKSDAVPGRYTSTWFQATKVGRYHLFCAEYCGTKHSGMIGWVEVMSPSDYQNWLSGGTAGGTMVQKGERLFQDLACQSCHLAGPSQRGPSLVGVPGSTVSLKGGGTVTADDAYLRESILNPSAKVTAGYEPIMPVYQGLVNEEGLMSLIAYLKTLTPEGSGAPAAITASPAAGSPPGEKTR